MSLRKTFATDPGVEKTGIELDYGEGRVLRIARAGGANVAYAKVLAQLTKPHRKLIQLEMLGNDKAQEIMKEAYAKAVVIGWAGVTWDDIRGDGNQDLAPFTVENCVELFTTLPDLFADVQEQASRAVLYRSVTDEGDLGN